MSSFNFATMKQAIGAFGGLLGGIQQASGLRATGQAALNTAYYNADVLKANLQNELDVFGREVRSFNATQRAQGSTGNVAAGSKSNLAVYSAAIAQAERQIKARRVSVQNEINAVIYEGQLQKAAANKQASTAMIGSVLNFATKLF